MRQTISICVIAMTMAFASAPAVADQSNPELNELFNELHDTLDTVEANRITGQIWQNWYQHESNEIETLMSKGESSMRQSNFKEAVQYYTEVIEADPSFAEGWNRRATVYYMMGEYDLSTSDVAKTLELEPRHFGALSGQGMIYIALKDAESALEYMQRALKENPHMTQVKRSIETLKKIIQDEVI